MLCCIGSEDLATVCWPAHWTTLAADLSIADDLRARRRQDRFVQASAVSSFILSSIQERKSAALVGADRLEEATVEA